MNIGSIGNLSTLMTSLESTKEEKESTAFQGALDRALAKQDDEALKEACQELEAYMLSQIFKKMKASVENEDGIIQKGDYEKMFESQLIDEQTKVMASAGGIGLADAMYRQLTQANASQANVPTIDTKR
jgi:flagellar protein FlgJ